MSNLSVYTDHQLEVELRSRRKDRLRREFGGSNLPFWEEMQDFKGKMYRGLITFPNLEEIDENEFIYQCGLIQSTSCYVTQASTEYMEGFKFVRYATTFLREVGYSAGRGVAFVGVPVDPERWNDSQHGRVPQRHRYFKYCLCDHKYGYGKNVGHCSTDYTCEDCGWTYNVDSSG